MERSSTPMIMLVQLRRTSTPAQARVSVVRAWRHRRSAPKGLVPPCSTHHAPCRCCRDAQRPCYHSLSRRIIPHHALSFPVTPYHSLSFLITPYHPLEGAALPPSLRPARMERGERSSPLY